MDHTFTIEAERSNDSDQSAASAPPPAERAGVALRRRAVKASTVALVVLVASLGLGVAKADAAIALVGFKANGVHIRSGPSTGYASRGLGYAGQNFCITSIVGGQNVNGNTNWVYGRNTRTGVVGYVHANYVYGTWIAGKYYPSASWLC